MGNKIPDGWLLCDGSPMNAHDSHLLNLSKFLAPLTKPDGVIILPDFRGRTVIGADSTVAGRHVGDIGGEENVNLTVDQLPPHSHPGGCHKLWSRSFKGDDCAPAQDKRTAYGAPNSTESVGGGMSHNNMPAFYCANVIIKF